jgi:hypothetical protein
MISHLISGRGILPFPYFPQFMSILCLLLFLGFRTAGAVAIEVEPGDMIMHNILVLHGSSSCRSPLRRTGMHNGLGK